MSLLMMMASVPCLVFGQPSAQEIEAQRLAISSDIDFLEEQDRVLGEVEKMLKEMKALAGPGLDLDELLRRSVSLRESRFNLIKAGLRSLLTATFRERHRVRNLFGRGEFYRTDVLQNREQQPIGVTRVNLEGALAELFEVEGFGGDTRDMIFQVRLGVTEFRGQNEAEMHRLQVAYEYLDNMRTNIDAHVPLDGEVTAALSDVTDVLAVRVDFFARISVESLGDRFHRHFE